MKKIGFATQFYTLWDYQTEEQYRTDVHGKHHHSGTKHIYHYIKNISIDLEKVKSLYPNVGIDDELKGISRDWTKTTKKDLPENIFWGGKYEGQLIDDILVSDFQYCLWTQQNYPNNYIAKHPIFVSYLEQEKQKDVDFINSVTHLKQGDVVTIDFVKNGYNADDNYTMCWTEGRVGDLLVFVECSGVRKVEGMYPYLMPELNGKIQKTKNKKIEVTIVSADEPRIDTDWYGNKVIAQAIKVK